MLWVRCQLNKTWDNLHTKTTRRKPGEPKQERHGTRKKHILWHINIDLSMFEQEKKMERKGYLEDFNTESEKPVH